MAEECRLHLPNDLPESTAEFYQSAMEVLKRAEIPFLIGGAYALAHHAEIIRHTKDLDIFMRPSDRDRALQAFEQAEYRTEIRYDYWLAKVFANGDMVDLIYRSPNGVNTVNDEWFERAAEGAVLGCEVKLCSAEHMIISKCYVMNNDRNDLADVMHLLFGCSDTLDWDFLISGFGKHPRLLLAHCILFGFVYPSERSRIPARHVQELLDMVRSEDSTFERVCNGTLLSHSQYAPDLDQRGFVDGRLQPHGNMSVADVLNATLSKAELDAEPSDLANPTLPLNNTIDFQQLKR